jgi:hypothetical protein
VVGELVPRPTDTEQRRARLTEICLALPEAGVTGEQHLGFAVRRRTFAYTLMTITAMVGSG